MPLSSVPLERIASQTSSMPGTPPPPSLFTQTSPPNHEYTWTVGGQFLALQTNFGEDGAYGQVGGGFRLWGDYSISPKTRLGGQFSLGITNVAESDDAKQFRPLRGNSDAEQDNSCCHHNTHHQAHEDQVAQQLSGEDRPPGTRIQQQRLERSAIQLDLKRPVERENAGKKRREPHGAHRRVAKRLSIRTESQTQQDENRHRK